MTAKCAPPFVSVVAPEVTSKTYLVEAARPVTVTWWTVDDVSAPRTSTAKVGDADEVPSRQPTVPVDATSVTHETVNDVSRTFATRMARMVVVTGMAETSTAVGIRRSAEWSS